MIGVGDIVARAGQSRRLLVVDVDRDVITVAWKIAGRPVEKPYPSSALVVLLKAPKR